MTALELWLTLLEQHIQRGTGKRAHFENARHMEWTAEELLAVLSDVGATAQEVARNTLESWRNGTTFPRTARQTALFKTFWPKGPRSDSNDYAVFRDALAAAKAERRLEKRTSFSKVDSHSAAQSGEPRKHPGQISPFPGLRSLGEADNGIFFGRTRETKQAIEQFATTHLLWVTGPSGNGKSSLIAAGVIPELKRGAIDGSERWRFIAFKPGTTPLLHLYKSLLDCFPLLRAGRSAHHLVGTYDAFRAKVSGSESIFIPILAYLAMLGGTPISAPVLFVDQFEECFTLSDSTESELFFSLLIRELRAGAVGMIATIRHDFLGRALELPDLGATISGSNFFSLPVPRRDSLREMIEGPAARAELALEDGLVERILDDTGDTPGALALMAYVLDELYKGRQINKLTIENYVLLGGVSGAIGARAEEVFSQLAMDSGTFHDLFGCMVEVNEVGVATRRRMTKSDIASPVVLEPLFAFAAARLVTTSEDLDSHDPVYEVAHEAVFREWPRLRDWIAETWDFHRIVGRMEREARTWDRRGRPDHLLPNQEAINEFRAAEANLFRTRRHEEFFSEFLTPEQDRLLSRLTASDCDHDQRREIGDRLAAIGDHRSGIGKIESVPQIDWIECAPGSTTIEDRKFEVRRFWIAKYPVTTEQFSAFVNAEDGLVDESVWTGTPEAFASSSLRPARDRMSNCPRDTISWYQARAFARWLDRRLQGTIVQFRDGSELKLTKRLEVRLPTESEWQLAATIGNPDRNYPWGDWDSMRANTIEAGLGRSIAVGMYPLGSSLLGVADLAGNVAEWCLTNYDLQVADTEEDVSKVLKGGSFYHNATHAAYSYRRRMLPSNAFSNFGFRLVIGYRVPRS